MSSSRALGSICLLLLLQVPLTAEMPTTAVKQMTTEEHIAKPGWWPRKGDAPKSDYVGTAACAECHSGLVKSQQQHAMSHAAAPTKVTDVKDPIHFSAGTAQYSITPEGNRLVYKVQYNAQSFSAPLEWTFGSGTHGQTFLYHRIWDWWETHITTFNVIGADVTPGESDAPPTSLTGALGRWVTDEELPQCFGCHTVAAVTEGKFDPASAVPGISCEGCHGPGAAHVALAHAGVGAKPGMVFNPSTLDPASSLDFCGACHRTWWDVAQMDNPGIKVVRFPAYRLEQSRCWGNGDARITCIACHNPHQPLVRDISAYDQKCLSCHVKSASVKLSADHPGAACPVKSSNCASCHMPKYEVPQTHSRFTDHRIRVVRHPGEIPTRWDD
jgi:hypothetical protein